MDSNILLAINKMNEVTGYSMQSTMVQVENGWMVHLYSDNDQLDIEIITRDGGVIISVMNRYSMRTPQVIRIMDAFTDGIQTAPPGGD